MAVSRWPRIDLRWERKVLLLFLALSLVRGVIYSAVIPPWQAPDEPKHFEYVRLVFEKRRPITAADLSPSLQKRIISSMLEYDFWKLGYGKFDPQAPPQTFAEIWPQSPTMLLAPPLYYLISAPWQFLASKDIAMQLYIARLVSVTLGVLVVLVSFLTAKELFPGDISLLIGIPAFVCFLPMYTYVTSSVMNDNLANLLASLILYFMVMIFRRGFTLTRAFMIATIFTLGAFTKRTVFFLVPTVVAGVPIYFWGRELKVTPNLRRIGLIAFLGILLIILGVLVSQELQAKLLAVVLLFSQSLYRWAFYSPAHLSAIVRALLTAEFLKFLQFAIPVLFESFWAYFGWLKIPLAPVWYRIIILTCLAAFLGLSRFGLSVLRKPELLACWQKQSLLLFCISFIFILVITISFFSFSALRPYPVPPQGRYLFPAIVPIATLFMLGVSELFPIQIRERAMVVLIGSFILFDLLSLGYYVILSFYTG